MKELEKTTEVVDFLNYKGKYRLIVEDVYLAVGKKENFSKFYNCITRLRIQIKNKDLVDLEKIKKTNLVKGINWNGNELQIIFGGEVYKIAEEFERFMDEIKRGKNSNQPIIKKTKKQKAIDFLKGVVMPVLPALMAGGLIMALQSILQLTGAIDEIKVSDKDPITNNNMITGVFYILSQTTLTLIGVLFCYTTTKTLKGNTIMGLLIGLSLASPFLFVSRSWHLFSFLGYDINIAQYGNAVLVQVVAGALYVYVDKWIKTWMPASVDMVFRHAIAYFLTVVPIFFGLGPFLGILETFVTYGLGWIGHVGFGIGAGIFCGLWQPLVLTGLHHTIMLPIKAEFPNNPTILVLATSINCIAQFGACMAVAVRTRNSNVRQACITASPACLLGTTEPIMYGVNLPKLWPFIYGCLGAFIGGMIGGWMDAIPYTLGGSGILNVLRYINGGAPAIIKIEVINLVCFAVPFILTIIFYKERISEIKANELVDSYLLRIYSSIKGLKFKDLKTECQHLIDNKTEFVKSHKDDFKNYDKVIAKLVKVQAKIRQLQSKIDAQKEKNAKKIAHLQTKNKNQKKIDQWITKFYQYDENEKMNLLRTKEKEINLQVVQFAETIQQIQNEYYLKTQTLVNKLISDDKTKERLQNLYFNAINSVDINYQFIEKKDGKIDWKQYKHYDHNGYLKDKMKLIFK